MALSVDRADLDHAVEAQLALLEARWPAALPLRWSPRSSFDALVTHLLPAFPEVTSDQAEALGRFCRLFAGSILLQDRLLDGDFRDSEVAVSSMRIVAMQHEAYRALHTMLPPEALFWARFREYLIAYADAFVIEDGFRRGRSPSELTTELGLSIAIAKHGVAKTIVAALVELSGRDVLLEPLCRSVDAVAIAFQMNDDLEDWRLDLWSRTPSILLARLPVEVWQGPADGDWSTFLERRVARHIYRAGHASFVLELARDALASVDLSGLPAMPWTTMIAALSARCDRMLATIEQTLAPPVRAAAAEVK